jgi:hypothetical protein
LNGAVAQLGERLNGIQEVIGSIPFSSTIKNKELGKMPDSIFIYKGLTATSAMPMKVNDHTDWSSVLQ